MEIGVIIQVVIVLSWRIKLDAIVKSHEINQLLSECLINISRL